MSKETFSRLVNQLSAEAEGERLAEQQALRRQRLFRLLGRGCVWVILAGVLAGGYAYREDIGQKLADYAGIKEPQPTGPNKLQELVKQAQKNAVALENASK
ncbi:MAG: hypothetical protein PCFJNLEI_03754 [Verrucomicrobiae bacterium]|nr:hypothetical protein [Verrucomicrobiae bacterium]